MDWMIMLAQLLLSISILVAVHEMGHLLTAKYFGMRVEKFSIGFPPKIWSVKIGETEYAISAIPIGGFVKISGMIDESLDTARLNEDPQPWEFRAKPAWQRLVVMLGGIVVNLFVGILIFIGITYFYGDTYIRKDMINAHGGFQVGPLGERVGLKNGDKIIQLNGHDFEYVEDLYKPETLLGADAYYTVERDGERVDVHLPPNLIEKFNQKEGLRDFIMGPRFFPVVESTASESLAERVGLQQGDRFVSLNGKPITYFDEVSEAISNLEGGAVTFTVLRDGSRLTFEGQLGDDRTIGFYSSPVNWPFWEQAREQKLYGFVQSIPLGTNRAFSTLAIQVKAFGKLISGVLSPRESLSGPLGIMQAFGNVWDWQHFWQLTGILSLVLAFMNLLPIPALDGGHVMFLGYEMISRRKPSDKFLETAQKAGMAFLLVLMVLIFANDIMKFF